MYILYQTVRSPIWDALTSIEFSVSGCMCVCVCRPVWVCTKMEAIYLRVHSISHDVELYIGIAWTTLISWFVIMCTKLISTQSEPVFRVRKIETLTYIPCSFSQSLSLSRSRLYKKKNSNNKKTNMYVELSQRKIPGDAFVRGYLNCTLYTRFSRNKCAEIDIGRKTNRNKQIGGRS